MLFALPTCYPSLRSPSIFLFAFLALSLVPRSLPSPPACGGLLRNATGVISTPRFPDSFPLPLRCTWTIENLDATSVIVLYFTQLYVTSGFTVTDYSILISPWSDPTVLFESNEKSALETQWISTPKQFMVVDVSLDSLFGTHIRALDNLLDVYGFNITYEIASIGSTHDASRPEETSDAGASSGETLAASSGEQSPLGADEDVAPSGVRAQVCSVVDCSFSGHCFANANFTAFGCSCFEGFSGPNCGDGPLCQGGQNVCENGARCRHAGATHILCVCPEGFTGVRCEIPVTKHHKADCAAEGDSSCAETGLSRYLCPHEEGDDVTPCRCGSQAGPVSYDKSRYEVRLALDAMDNDRTGVAAAVNRTVTKLFRGISKIENLQILNITSHLDVWFHFYGARSDRDKYHMTLLKLLNRSNIGSYGFLSKEFAFNQEPMIQNKAILVNQKHNQVREGKEFILSCVAEGSRLIQFRWYKDDAPINVNCSMREMWSKLSSRDSQGQYIATLGIQSAHKLDQGRFTCQVIDLGYEQCRSLDLEVHSPPEVKISPLSVTVQRGSNLTIKCMSPDERNFGNSSDKFGYSWIRDGALFPMNSSSEIWEDLEPGGSVLRVINVQKSVIYSCLVTAPNVSPSLASARLHTIEPSRLTPLCPHTTSYGLSWPATLNGETAFVESVPGRCTASRACTLASTGPGVDEALWELEDFSACVPPPLYAIQTNFQSLCLGYETTSINITLQHTADYLGSGHQWYPGQAESTVTLLSNLLRFIQHTTRTSLDFVSSSGLLGVSEYFYAIVNYLLHWDQPLPSFVHRQKVIELQAIIEVWSLLWCNQLSGDHKRLLFDSLLIDVRKLYNLTSSYIGVQQPSVHFKTSQSSWSPNTSVTFESTTPVGGSKGVLNLVVIAYANLSQYLAPRYINKDTDVLYEVHSSVVSTCLGDNGVKMPGNQQDMLKELKIVVQFSRPANESIPVGWNLTCGVSENGGESFQLTCLTQVHSHSVTCTCSRTGLHALLITFDKHKMLLATPQPSHLRVLVGFSSCILEVAFTLLHILPRWFRRKSWFLFLKVKFCLVILLLMILLTYLAYQSHLGKGKALSCLLLIQYLVLIALSCHLTGLLIIYTQVMVHPLHTKDMRPSILSILHILSLLIVLSLSLSASHVTLVYYLCTCCTCLYVLAFTCLYVYVRKYLRELRASIRDKCVLAALTLRQRILDKSAVLVLSLSLTYTCTILHLSQPSSLPLQYLLALVSCGLGLSVCLVYYVQATPHQTVKASVETQSSSNAELCDSDLCEAFDLVMGSAGEMVRGSGDEGTEEIPLTESTGSGVGKMVTFSHDLVRDSEPPDPSAPPLSPGCDGLDILPPTIVPGVPSPQPDDHSPTTHVCVEQRPPRSILTPRPSAHCQDKESQRLLCSADVEPGSDRSSHTLPTHKRSSVPSHPTLISFSNTAPRVSYTSAPYSSSPSVSKSSLSPHKTVQKSEIPYGDDGLPYALDHNVPIAREFAPRPAVIPYAYPYTPISIEPCTVLDPGKTSVEPSRNSHVDINDSHRKMLDLVSKPPLSGCSSFKMNSLPRRGSNSQMFGGKNGITAGSGSNSPDLTGLNKDLYSMNKALDFREVPEQKSPHSIQGSTNSILIAPNNHIPRGHRTPDTLENNSRPPSRSSTPNRCGSQTLPEHHDQMSHHSPSVQRSFLSKHNQQDTNTHVRVPFVNNKTQSQSIKLDNHVSPGRNSSSRNYNCQSNNCEIIDKSNVDSSRIPSQPNIKLDCNPCVNRLSNCQNCPITKPMNSQSECDDHTSILVSSEALNEMAYKSSVGSLIVDGVRIDEISVRPPKSGNDLIESFADSTCTDSSDSAIADVDSNPNLSGAESSEHSNVGGELLTQISQDLDYLLNAPREDFSSMKRRKHSGVFSSPSRMSRSSTPRHAASAGCGEACGNYVTSPSKLIGNKDSVDRIS